MPIAKGIALAMCFLTTVSEFLRAYEGIKKGLRDLRRKRRVDPLQWHEGMAPPIACMAVLIATLCLPIFATYACIAATVVLSTHSIYRWRGLMLDFYVARFSQRH